MKTNIVVNVRVLPFSRLQRRLLVRIAPFWLLVLIIGSLLPGNVKSSIGTSTRYSEAIRGSVSMTHRLTHFGSFGSTALLLLLITRRRGQQAAVLVGTLALSFSIEYAQHLLYEQGIEWWDIRDDFYADVTAYIAGQSRALKAALVRDP